MHVLEFTNYSVQPTEECFLIKPLRDLYNKDKSKTKDTFMTQLSVIYFMCDPRSSYNYILDEDERLQLIIQQEGLPKDFKINKELKTAMEAYLVHVETPASLLIKDTLVAIEKVRKFLRDVNLNKVDSKGKPLYTISAVTMAIKQIPQLAKDLVEAEKTVAKEIDEQGRVRGAIQKTILDDGFDVLFNS